MSAPAGSAERKLARFGCLYVAALYGAVLALAGLVLVLLPVGSGARLVAAVVVLYAGLGGLFLMSRIIVRRRAHELARADGPLLARDELPPELQAAVDEVEASGFVWVRGRSMARGPSAALLGSDGVVVVLTTGRQTAATTVWSCLVPDEWWLVTATTADSWVGSHVLVDVHRPIEGPWSEVVAHHRETRAALARQLVAAVPMTLEGFEVEADALRRGMVADPHSVSPPFRPGRVRPLLERQELPGAIGEIRARQRQLGIAAPGAI